MTHTLTRSRMPSWLLGSGIIAAAMAVLNLSTYGFTILAARLLGPSEYGALAALMGLLLVVSVIALGLQATGARRVSATPDLRPAIEAEVLSATYLSALLVGLLCLLAVPVVATTLRLDSWLAAALMAVAAVPLTVMGGQAGILQGERRWLPLAGIYAAQGLGRILCGFGFLLLRPDALGAMLGVTVGAVAPALLGWAVLRRRSRAERSARPGPTNRGAQGPLRETVRNSHALLAFFVLTNADVIIARVLLSDHESGLYAGGLILAKAVLFLPQFVVVVAFPSMSAEGARGGVHLSGLAVVLGLGLSGVIGTWLLSDLALVFIGGDAYAEIQGLLWAFAGIGTLLALTQMMVYSGVARQSRRTVIILWSALVVLLSLVPLVDTVGVLVLIVASVDTLLLGVLVARGLRHRSLAVGTP